MNYRNHFTSRAIKAIEFAQYVSRNLEQDYIGTEHILLGLLHEEGSVAYEALSAVGLNFDTVMQRVEAMVSGETDYPSDNPYYTPRAKRVMEGPSRGTEPSPYDTSARNISCWPCSRKRRERRRNSSSAWAWISTPCRMRCWRASTARILKATARPQPAAVRRAAARISR